MATQKYKRGKDGFFKTKVWDGTYNPDGSKHRKNLRTDKSSRELERLVNEFNQAVSERRALRKSNVSFLEYSRMWREVYKANRSANTIAMYDNIINKHFLPLESCPLQDINRIHIQTVINNAAGKPRTQIQILQTFKQVLRSAVSDKLFADNVFSDIFDNMDPIRYSPGEKRPLTEYEKKAVFHAAYKYDQDKIYIYIIYGCGLRREEAAALTVFDFNFQDESVCINKAYEFTRNTPALKSPKTENGYRTIPIPRKILPAVKEYVQRLKCSGRTQLFTTLSGGPFTKSAYDKMWARILKAMQAASDQPIGSITGHMFRHNYCTNLCYQIPRISIKHIARLMGDTEAVVLKVYNHIILEKEDSAGAVNDAMNF